MKKFSSLHFVPVLLALTCLLFVPRNELRAETCAKVGGYTDRNCDGVFRIVFLGDSLVYGIGDTKNKNKGGYVLRVAKKLPNASVINYGVPGATSEDLLAVIKAAFSKNPTKKQAAFKEAVFSADIIVVDLGRNDYFTNNRKRTPQQTLGTLREINSSIVRELSAADSPLPYIVQAVIMKPNRTDQGKFVAVLNPLIQKSNSASFHADLRFDETSKRLLQADQIHPNPKGYDAITKIFLSYLQKKIG